MWLRALLACGLAVPLPLSAVTSQSFQVSATITPGVHCKVTPPVSAAVTALVARAE